MKMRSSGPIGKHLDRCVPQPGGHYGARVGERAGRLDADAGGSARYDRPLAGQIDTRDDVYSGLSSRRAA